MSDELVATNLLIAWSVFAFIFSLVFIRRVMSNYDIDELKVEFEEIVQEKMQGAIDLIGEAFEGILTDPTVSKAFSIIGSQGGNAKSQNSAVDSMANDILDGPQFAAIKMGAEAMGLDISEYIEKHGAVNTLQAAKQLGSLVGVDIMNLDIGSLALPGPASSGVRRVF